MLKTTAPHFDLLGLYVLSSPSTQMLSSGLATMFMNIAGFSVLYGLASALDTFATVSP